jgi:hypothetical protein
MSLHAFFFFLGQAAGPLVYGFALAHVGTPVTLSISGAVMLASGTLSARLLHRRPVALG